MEALCDRRRRRRCAAPIDDERGSGKAVAAHGDGLSLLAQTDFQRDGIDARVVRCRTEDAQQADLILCLIVIQVLQVLEHVEL